MTHILDEGGYPGMCDGGQVPLRYRKLPPAEKWKLTFKDIRLLPFALGHYLNLRRLGRPENHPPMDAIRRLARYRSHQTKSRT